MVCYGITTVLPGLRCSILTTMRGDGRTGVLWSSHRPSLSHARHDRCSVPARRRAVPSWLVSVRSSCNATFRCAAWLLVLLNEGGTDRIGLANENLSCLACVLGLTCPRHTLQILHRVHAEAECCIKLLQARLLVYCQHSKSEIRMKQIFDTS